MLRLDSILAEVVVSQGAAWLARYACLGLDSIAALQNDSVGAVGRSRMTKERERGIDTLRSLTLGRYDRGGESVRSV